MMTKTAQIHSAPCSRTANRGQLLTHTLSLLSCLAMTLAGVGCDEPKPPKVELSASEPLALGVPITILNNGSGEGNGVSWTLTAKPPASQALLIEPDDLSGEEKRVLTPDVLGRYEVTASESLEGFTATDRIELIVSCAPPKWGVSAEFTHGDEGVVGQPVSVIATLSAETAEGCPELDPLSPSVSWALLSKPNDSGVDLSPVGERARSFTPDVRGAYLIGLTVSDALNRRDALELSYQASCGASAPEVSASASFNEGDSATGAWVVGRPLSLSVSASDPDEACGQEQPLSLTWRFVELPALSDATLSPATGSSPWFTPDVPGIYLAEVRATDPQGNVGHAEVRVEVSECGSASPVISEVSATPTPSLLSPSQLAVSWSDADSDEACASLVGEERFELQWSVARAPTTSRALPLPVSALQPSFAPDVPGEYTLRVEVRDLAGHVASSELSFTVEDCGSAVPSVSLTASAQEVALGSPISVQALPTDPDISCGATDEVSLSWRVISAPAGAPALPLPVAGPQALSFATTPTVAGQYLIEVTPTDLAGHVGAPSRLSFEALDCGALPPEIDQLSLSQGEATETIDLGALPDSRTLSASLSSTASLSATVSDPNEACRARLGLPESAERALDYRWRVEGSPQGSRLSLIEATTPSVELDFDLPGTYRLSLVVSDGVQSSDATVQVEVNSCGSAAPVISWLDPIGGQGSASGVGRPVSLSVTAQDPDEAPGCDLEQALSYQWRWRSLPAGSEASLQASATSSAWFNPDLPGVYLAEVSVSDPQGHSSAKTATISVGGCGAHSPVITAMNLTIAEDLNEARVGSPMTLSAEWSDLDLTSAECSARDEHSFSWRLLSVPNGSAVALSNPSAERPSLTPDLPGVYFWELELRDASGLSAVQEDGVVVSSCGSASPAVTLSLPSEPLAVGVNNLVEAIVTDADELCAPSEAHSYRYDWRLTALPAGASEPFVPQDRPSLTWRADQAGRYELSVTVIDKTGRVSAPAIGEVVVEACGDLSPSLSNLRVDGSLTVGGVARLLADVTDPNQACDLAGPISYEWSLIRQPEGSETYLNDSAQATPSLTFDQAGDYSALLTARTALRTEASAELSWVVSSCGGATPVATATLAPTNPSVGDLVQLIGSATDADSDPACGDAVSLSYHWVADELPLGYEAPLLLTGRSPWVSVDHPGRYRFTLRVSDEDGNLSDPASISLNVEDCGATAPSINPASLSLTPASPQVNERATLSATSADPDGACGGVTDAQLRWRVVSVPEGATLSLGVGDQPELYASAQGQYTVEVTPVGADGLTGEAERFSFEVGPCGSFSPTLSLSFSLATDPAPLTETTLGATPKAINAYASTADADEVAPCALSQRRSVRWWVSEAPLGLAPELSPVTPISGEQASGSAISFTPVHLGEYTLTAEVTDETGNASQAQASFTLTTCGASRPQLSDVSVSPATPRTGAPAQLSATLTPADASCESTDPASYQWRWRLFSRPSGSVASLQSAARPSPTLTPDVPGDYLLSAQVISPSGATSDELRYTLSVPDCGARAPVITVAPSVAGPVNLGEQLSLTVSGLDPDQDCGAGAEYSESWRLVRAPVGSVASLSLSTGAEVGLTPDVEGEYIVEVSLIEDSPLATGVRLESEPARVSVIAGSCGRDAPQALISAVAPVIVAPAEALTVDTFACAEAPFVQLLGGDSVDPNEACGLGGPLSYQWEVVEVSPGLEVALSGSSSEGLNLSVSGVGEGSTATLTVRLTTTNRAGLTDSATAVINLRTLFAPQANNINPGFLCDQAQAITVSGDHIYTYEGALPRMIIGGLTLNADSVAGCTPVADTGGRIERCTSVNLTLPGGLDADLYQAVLRNPYPLGCDDRAPPELVVISSPSIESFSPRPICRGQFDGRLTLTGTGFVRDIPNAQEVQITVNGEPAVLPTLADCAVANGSLELCGEASFELPLSQKDVAELDVSLSNPNPGACDPASLTTVERFIQSEPPQIDDVVPSKICDQGGRINLIGQHLEAGISISLAGQLADSVTAINGELEVSAYWTEQPTPRFAPGVYDLIATNPTNCATTLPEQVRITEGPVPFFVDPPIVYNGITLQATAYLGNLFGGSVTRVQVSQGAQAPIDLDFAFDPATPGQLKIFIPQGIPVGLYDLTLFDDVNCPGTTAGLLNVTDLLTVNITELTPPFAWTDSVTPVIAFAEQGAGFVPTPRAYLTPSLGDECVQSSACNADELCVNGRCSLTCESTADCDAGLACVSGACVAQASELRATSIRSETELQGAVDQGFAPGLYDLVVVNPDGSVGLLNQAMKVNVDPPPAIKAVSPGSWEVNNNALPVQVIGTGFNGASLTATCVTGGATDTFALNVISEQPEVLNITVDTTRLTATSICSIRVFNADESYDDFSPLTATNPSGNFVSFSVGPALPAGAERRLPSVTYAEIPNGGPALFLMGGDNGVQALSDMFTARIDSFGALGAWEPLDTTLPYGLTATQAVTLGRFIYILSGQQDGGGDTVDVLRAELLDPLYVPEVTEVDFEFDPAINGLDTGVYYYRISAVYPENDPNNPGGESLPSEPQPVFIPQIPNVGVRLILQWEGLPDAESYRVYRSPSPDLLLGQEELIAELPATELSFTDDGSLNTVANTGTLSQGILGNWAVAAQLNVGRSSHAVVVAPDPDTADLHHIYAIGGLIGGVATDSYEYISVDASAPRNHQLSAPSLVNAALTQSRSRLGALTGTPQVASYLSLGADPKSAVIYVLGGEGSKNVEVGEVLPGGLISPFQTTGNINNTKAGYATAIANNNLVIVGGHNGGASTKADKGVICGADCDPNVEEVSSWSSLGNVGVRSTVDPGYSSAKGFFYVVAGGDGTNPISTKVDVALLGGTP